MSVEEEGPERAPQRAARSRENTRARLIEAAADVFAAKGLEGATLDDLTGAAGFTRGAFYSNFETKYELFFAVHDEVSDRIVAVIRQTLAQRPDDRGSPDDLIATLYENLRPHGRLWYLLRTEANAVALRSTEYRARFELSRAVMRAQMRDVLAEQFRRLGLEVAVDLDTFTDLLVGTYLQLLLQENLDGADVRAIVQRCLPAMFLGVTDAWDVHAFVAGLPGSDG